LVKQKDYRKRFVLIYRNNLKNREFGKEAPLNFQAAAVRSERPLPGRQGASEHENFEEKPTMPKTDSSGYFGIVFQKKKEDMQTVLVTGGAGYIGSHVCKALALAGYLPIAYDNFCQGHTWAVKWGPLVQKDLFDHVELKKTIEQHKPVGAIHLAGHLDMRESLRDPGKYFRNNVFGTLGLVEALCFYGVKAVVFSSTAGVYGIPASLPIHESHSLEPINPYGKSKKMAEEILADFAKSHELNFAALRYFNAAGADPEGEIGEAHDPETHLIPVILQTVLKQRSHLTLFGTDHPTFDGTAIRDYIHVSDLATAHVKALEHLLQKKENLTLNLGTGTGYSIRQVISAVEAVTGTSVPLELAPRSPADPPSLVADSTAAQTVLKWKPKKSDLHTIIETAWNWHRK
jgi:UDP-arabinose 4-epimerase